MTQDRFLGCLLGLALGDALGAPFEGGAIERFLWHLIGTTSHGKMRWTDDTQMSLDLAESLLDKEKLDVDDLAMRFAAGYRWSRGYGPGTAKLLKRIRRGVDWQKAARSVYPDGSFGNGGAMRSPVIGLFYARHPDELLEAARVAAGVTHAHPLGLEGAVLIACATALALDGMGAEGTFSGAARQCKLEPFTNRLALAGNWLQSGEEQTPKSIARQLGHGISASESCVTALYTASRFLNRPFNEMKQFVVKVGGDADTIGAMAGAIWGAANGVARLPQDKLKKLEQSVRLNDVALALYERRS